MPLYRPQRRSALLAGIELLLPRGGNELFGAGIQMHILSHSLLVHQLYSALRAVGLNNHAVLDEMHSELHVMMVS